MSPISYDPRAARLSRNRSILQHGRSAIAAAARAPSHFGLRVACVAVCAFALTLFFIL